MDYLKHETAVVRGHKFNITELSARAMMVIQAAETESEIAALVVQNGCDEFIDVDDPAAEMPMAMVVELAQAIFELSGLGEGGEAKKPSGTVQKLDSSTG